MADQTKTREDEQERRTPGAQKQGDQGGKSGQGGQGGKSGQGGQKQGGSGRQGNQ